MHSISLSSPGFKRGIYSVQMPIEEGPGVQKKLWEIQNCYKCSLIGTCLNRLELRTLAKKKVFSIESKLSDYQLHSRFIAISDRTDLPGKALQKYFQRKYRTAIKPYLKAVSDEELKILWEKDVAEGWLDSAWWGILSHPHASEQLVATLYRDLHMLSHDFLCNYRPRMLHARQQENKIRLLEEVLGSERQIYRKEKRELIADLDQARKLAAINKALIDENQKWRNTADRFHRQLRTAASEGTDEANVQKIADLRQMNNSLCGELDETVRNLEAVRLERSAALAQVEELKAALCRQERREVEQEREIESLEQMLIHAIQEVSCAKCKDHNTEHCPGLNLCGKTVLYVGGLNKMVPHYRQLVEKSGGRFLHHDGGVECSRSILPKLLNTADAVFCPLDCISHDACQCIKKMCKRNQKPFVLMRSAGLSSLARGLSEITQ